MILGKRVRLRPLEREDLPRFVRWVSDPEIRAHVAQYKPLSLAQEEQWYARNLEAGDTQSWAIDAHREYLMTETLTVKWATEPLEEGAFRTAVKVDGRPLHIELRKVAS